MGGRLAPVGLLLLAGCLGAPAGRDVPLVLDTPEGFAPDGLSFEILAVTDPGDDVTTCDAFLADPNDLTVPAGSHFLRFQHGLTGSAPVIGGIGFGDVRVLVRARDATCHLRAAGCVDQAVGPDTPSSIQVPLDGLDGSVACPTSSDRCVGFVCRSEACIGVEEPLDEDGDGAFVCSTTPGEPEDCDDFDPSRSPFHSEICNGLDDDCDGVTDEDVPSRTYYRDEDGDGWGDTLSTREACAHPDGFVTRDGDCDDTDASVFPDAPLRCSGVDDDCDGSVDPSPPILAHPDEDGDGYGREGSTAVLVCGSIPDGMAEDATDCDDGDFDRHPGTGERCNDIDDDCDGVVDESITYRNYYRDGDGDGYGAGAPMNACTAPGSGWVTRAGDCDDASAAFHPGARDRCCTMPDEGCGPDASPVGGGEDCSYHLYPYYRWFEENVIGRGNFRRSSTIDDRTFEDWVRTLSGRASSWTCFTVDVGDVTRGRAMFCIRKGRTGSTPNTPYPCNSSCTDFPSSGAESLTAVKAAVCWSAEYGSGAHGRRIITPGSCGSGSTSCCPSRLLQHSDAAIMLFNAFGPEQTVCAP